jgi:hypothetical protein
VYYNRTEWSLSHKRQISCQIQKESLEEKKYLM